eukprot:Gb_37567 [translate_table: standard]
MLSHPPTPPNVPPNVAPIPLNSIPKHKCTLGCPILDNALRGGIPCGSITELVGECGSGKTQLSLQLLLCAQLPICQGGLNASSVYIHSEGYFPSRRLQQLAQAFIKTGGFRQLLCNQSGHIGVQPKLGQLSINQPIGSQPEFGQFGVQSDLGQFSTRSGLGQSSRTATVANPVGDNTGKRKCEEPYNEEANEKRIRCNDFGGNSENEFWGAIDSAEWQVLDSITHSYAHKNLNFINGNNNAFAGIVDSDPCENVFVRGVHTIEELLNFLEHIQILLENPIAMPVRLIVIDSVAALFRSDFDNTANDLVKRANLFFKLSSKLKYYAQKFNLAVVATNQVVDCVDSEGSKGSMSDLRLGNFQSLVSSGRRVVPALGLSWAHCVNIRLFLSRLQGPGVFLDSNPDSFQKVLINSSSAPVLDGYSGFGSMTVRRKMQVVFAPHLPGISCDFIIERDGVRGIPSS